jgi:YVTN family beta-propeller protein
LALKVLGRVPSGPDPHEVVASTPDDGVAVIDLKTLDVAGRIDAGKQPDGLARVRRRQ